MANTLRHQQRNYAFVNLRWDEPMAQEASNALRQIDDDTLLEMYDAARVSEDVERCDAISAELHWRGIHVHPCGGEPLED